MFQDIRGTAQAECDIFHLIKTGFVAKSAKMNTIQAQRIPS